MYDGKVVFKVDLDTKDFTPQLEKTKKDLDSLMFKYDTLKKKPVMDRTDKKNLENYTEEGKLKIIAAANAQRKKDLLELQAQIQETANKYIDLKAKQDAVFNTSYKKGLSSVKNINMMDNSAYNKSYALQYNQLGNSMAKVSGELPYVADGFKDIGKEAEFAGDETEEAGKKAQTSGKLFDKGFSKGLKSVKRLALGIVGIRSAYMLARKAASSYMAQDEDLAKSMQSVWTGLGAFLAPLLETLTNLMLKFVGYLNVFIKALTGKDLIASANAKILEKQAKAQEKLNKATKEYQNYDFDVIRTQQTDKGSSGGGTDDASLINIPELNENIVKKLQDLAKWLKENKDLIEEVGIALGITFGAIAIANLLSNIGALIGSGTLLTGLAGLLAILSLVAIVWTIHLVTEGFKELSDAEKTAADLAEHLKEIAHLTGKDIVENPDEKTPEEIEQATEDYQEATSAAIEYYDAAIKGAKKTKKEAEDWLYPTDVGSAGKNLLRTFYDAGNALFGKGYVVTDANTEIIEDANREIQSYGQSLQEAAWNYIQLAKQGRLSGDGLKALIYIYQNYGDKLEEINQYSDDYIFTIDQLRDAIGDYAGIYPEVTSEMFGFNKLSDAQQRQMIDLTEKFMLGKISATDYAKELAKIPTSVETKVATNGILQAGQNIANYIKDAINKVPTTKNTKFTVDDKDAETKTKNYSNNLLKLPTSILTTIKATLDTSAADWQFQQFKQKVTNFPIVGGILDKLFSVIGFAGGGYVSQPTFAMVGEGKYNEYVIPDGEDYISRLANEIGKYGTGGNGTVNVYLDGRLIQRQVDDTRNRVNFAKNR